MYKKIITVLILLVIPFVGFAEERGQESQPSRSGQDIIYHDFLRRFIPPVEGDTPVSIPDYPGDGPERVREPSQDGDNTVYEEDEEERDPSQERTFTRQNGRTTTSPYEEEKMIESIPEIAESILGHFQDKESNAERRRTNLFEQQISSDILPEDIRNTIDQQRETVRETVKEEREEALSRSENIRTEMLDNIENYKVTMNEEVRNRLGETLTDRVTQLGKNISMLNMNFSSPYLNVLDNMENLLDNMEDRAERIEEMIDEDLTLFYTKLIEIREDISMARDAVLLQKGVIYNMSISETDDLRETIKEAIDSLNKEHQFLRGDVIGEIREKISEANTLLREAVSASIN